MSASKIKTGEICLVGQLGFEKVYVKVFSPGGIFVSGVALFKSIPEIMPQLNSEPSS